MSNTGYRVSVATTNATKRSCKTPDVEMTKTHERETRRHKGRRKAEKKIGGPFDQQLTLSNRYDTVTAPLPTTGC